MAFAALAALIIEPGASLAIGRTPSSAATLDGQMVVLHSDDFAAGTATNTYAVQTADGTVVQVDVSLLGDVDRLVGRSVRLAVADAESGAGLVATNTLSSGQVSTSAALTGTRKIAVVLFNFTNDTSQPWTTSSVANTVFGVSSSVAAYYKDVSYGSTTLSGDVFSWVTIPYDNSSCLYSTWSAAALAAAHVDASQYANVVYAFPRTSCQWAGLSTIGGKSSWINGAMTVRTVGHELGHDFGVHHASALSCTSGGVRVTLSAMCTSTEYGDPFSIMGTGTNHLTNLQRAQIGWLTDVQTIAISGEYSLSPSELTAQPRLLRIARGDGTYLYFEFRQPYGTYDAFPTTAPAVNGVIIRIAPDTPVRAQSKLLDSTPSTATFDDAPLAVGRSFTDPLSGVMVSTTAVASSAAHIRVSWPGASPALPSPTPAPTSSPVSTPPPTASPSPTPAPSPTPTPTPTASPSPAPTPSPTPTPTPTASPPTEINQLTAPPQLDAVRVRGRKVRLTWAASLGPVARYRIYRNGTRIGRTTTLRFIDYVPRGVNRATYVVRAVDRNGKLGPRSRVTLRLP